MDDDRTDTAFAALASGGHARALAMFDQLVAEDSADPEARDGRARALYAMGRDREAQQEAKTLVTLTPDDPEAHVLHGRIAWALSLASLAQTSYERALELSGRAPEILVEYAEFLARERGVRPAEEAALECVRRQPEWPEAWIVMGLVRQRQHRMPEAKVAYERALSLDPDHPAAQVSMIGFLSETGQDEAAAALTDLLGDDPASTEFVALQRRFLKERGQTRTLIERDEFREAYLAPSLSERWLTRTRVVWTIIVVGSAAGLVFLALQSSIPFTLVPMAGLLVAFVMWRYATAG